MGELTACESITFTVLMNEQREMSLKEITEAVNLTFQKNWSKKNSKFFLERLESLGHIAYEKCGRKEYYRLANDYRTADGNLVQSTRTYLDFHKLPVYLY